MIPFDLPAIELASRLLGCTLCRRLEDGRLLRGVITETEAYFGQEDTACHAHRGKTARNAPMYEQGGIAYIYLCYGMHEMLNVVSGPENHPEAVLIRGIEGFDGPGKLTKHLQITRALNRADLSSPKSPLFLEDRAESLPAPGIECLPRVGIGYAEKEDRERLWRYRIAKKG